MKGEDIGGAVYVYINNAGVWEGNTPVRLIGTKDSMFGVAVENIGDINQDSYKGDQADLLHCVCLVFVICSHINCVFSSYRHCDWSSAGRFWDRKSLHLSRLCTGDQNDPCTGGYLFRKLYYISVLLQSECFHEVWFMLLQNHVASDKPLKLAAKVQSDLFFHQHFPDEPNNCSK